VPKGCFNYQKVLEELEKKRITKRTVEWQNRKFNQNLTNSKLPMLSVVLSQHERKEGDNICPKDLFMFSYLFALYSLLYI
jgi:hypothetical protein